MVATSPVHTGTTTQPTPIEHAKEKAKTAARGDDKPEMPIRFVIPSDEKFEQAGAEYLGALDLRYIARKVIEETGVDLNHIDLSKVDFAWKFKGGKDKGRPKLGDVRKQDDVAKFHGGQTFFVWLAADHCRSLIDQEVATRALVYSMLARIGFEYNDQTGVITSKLNPPDVSYFYGEINHYGNWRSELTVAANVFEQNRIPGL